MKICCISDIHGWHENLSPYFLDPDYVKNIDILIVAGDSSDRIEPTLNYHEQMDFLEWLETIDIDCKVVVGGNHDTAWWRGMIPFTQFKTIDFLTNESLVFNNGEEEVKIWGSPYTIKFGREGWAWNMKQNKMDALWQTIPEDADIVVTHQPPKGIRDLTEEGRNVYVQTGCKALLNHIHRVQPKLHVFGHLHDEPNVFNHGVSEQWGTKFVNASICNLRQTQFNEPIIVEI